MHDIVLISNPKHELNLRIFLGLVIFILAFMAGPTLSKSVVEISAKIESKNNTYIWESRDEIGLVVGEKRISIKTARTKDERTRGLSGISSLEQNEGMLFIFEESGFHHIWMKDMFISIDILWVDENYNIIHIEKNISPDTYPKSYTSKQKAKYVLEVPAGFVKNNNIKIGDQINFL